uniref:Uncharacterized protein n=1 Tax=Cuerna arida TaxID=1464854 RepID=A0A1B6GSY5_9HEMI
MNFNSSTSAKTVFKEPKIHSSTIPSPPPSGENLRLSQAHSNSSTPASPPVAPGHLQYSEVVKNVQRNQSGSVNESDDESVVSVDVSCEMDLENLPQITSPGTFQETSLSQTSTQKNLTHQQLMFPI